MKYLDDIHTVTEGDDRAHATAMIRGAKRELSRRRDEMDESDVQAAEQKIQEAEERTGIRTTEEGRSRTQENTDLADFAKQFDGTPAEAAEAYRTLPKS
jgi:hypothetical protein